MKNSTIGIITAFALIAFALVAVFLNRTGTPEETQADVDCDLSIVVAGVQSEGGSLYGMLCKEDENFPNSCEISQVVKAKEGTVKFDFSAIPNGIYAFAAYHDENGDQILNMSKNRYPSEGLVFSRNSMGPMGPPSFSQSSFELCKNRNLLANIRYLENQ
ncbi:MAG: hypothetical protein ACI9SP_000830 [Arenicella sp.]|jgi:uncharacterized protein (DUF2141 family)